jgi:dTDP-4-amino-4,6-dideoxygalactose transaminase
MTPQVPYFGYAERCRSWLGDVLDVVKGVGLSDEFILKSQVARFEAAVAAKVGARHAVACASGTGALQLSLLALGVGPGDRVVTPAFSFIASASTIALVGATPVFADVDEESATLDPDAAAAAAYAAGGSGGVAAILPAHLFSSLAAMDPLRDLADRLGARLIEDSAVSFGAELAGRPAGGLGDVGVFSFFPGKPLGGIGDGGIVVADDDWVAAECRMLRNHGQDPGVRFLYHRVGLNCRMDETVAAFLLRRLARLDDVLERRRRLAEIYQDRLRPLRPALATPPDDFAGRSVHAYVVRTAAREALRQRLLDRGVEAKVYYPAALPLQPAFRALGHAPGDFPVAERLAREHLALPLHEEMDPRTVEFVADEVAGFFAE